MSAVNSLEDNVLTGFSELGTDVVYIERMPWVGEDDVPWWKYLKWPNASIEDYEAIKRKSKLADDAAYCSFTGGRTLKYRSSSLENVSIIGSTYEYYTFTSNEIEFGRYFTKLEADKGSNKVILGHNAAKELFGTEPGLNKEIKLFGQKFQVIGILASEGDNMFNFLNMDDMAWISYTNLSKFVNPKSPELGELLPVKKRRSASMEDISAELTGILRAHRKLRPREESNFFINEISMLTQILGEIFSVINLAGFTIGIFALIVGMFSVANIMFVSVKERTNIIGVKKALGAKKIYILLEFLIEAIILCLIGGGLGILLVHLSLMGISAITDFPMSLSFQNLVIGIIASITVGIIAGLLPAYSASNLDPVEAIRQ